MTVTRGYSEHGQDLIAWGIFEGLGITRPSYLDLGAYHPFDISNTALFYERGCRGINVEANPRFIEQFKIHRPDDINICAAVGATPGRATFHTISLTAYKDFEKYPPFEVDVLTVGEIITKYAGGIFPDFLSMDIEGSDLSVLETLSGDCLPKVICLEAGTNVSGEFVDIGAQAAAFLKTWFRRHSRVGNDLIFVRNA